MKKIILLVSVFALLASPAFAKKAPPVKLPYPVPECRTVETVKKQAKEMQDGTAVEYELTGEELQKLNDLVAKKSGKNPPEGMDTLLVLSQPNNPVWLAVIFVKGCVTQLFPIGAENFKKLLNASKDDGSI